MLQKGLVFAIVVLFVGTSIVSAFNDNLLNEFELKKLSYRGHIAYGFCEYGFVQFELDEPGNLTVIIPNSFSACGADFDDNGDLYFCTYLGHLFKRDYETGDVIFIGNTPIPLNGLTHDTTTDIWYGCTSTEIYTVDINTAATNIVGSTVMTNILIGLACDYDGNIYSYDVQMSGHSTLYTINKTNGHATAVGDMGYGFCYAQDPAYDRNNDTLYIAGYFNNGFPSALLTCDTLSGACTIVGNFQGNMEVDGFAIPYNSSNPPTTPTIYGPDNGTTNVEYTFCTDAITDPEGDSLFCLWYWGDGSNSGWLGPYASGETMCASHVWAQPGVYCIMLKLKDSYGMESEWSDPFCITIVENHPPSDLIIDGPNHCRVGVEYKWSFVSTDPDGDNITYYVDWGDECGGAEWHGPYPSGEIVFLAHKYTSKNTLIINAMAVDEHGAESNMTYFEVTIPRITSFNSMFLKLLERFPHAFPMLRYMLGLQ